MVTELGLKGNELIVYALIYGFSQDGESGFLGSQSYIGEWTHSRREVASRTISRLERKGLISKTFTDEGTVLYVALRPCDEKSHPPVTKSHAPCDEKSHPPVTKSHAPCDEKSHNNNIYKYNTNIDISNNIVCGSSSVKTTTTEGAHAEKSEFVPPTEDDVRAYCQSRGNDVDPKRFVAYYDSEEWMRNGKPIRNWKAVVRYWESNGIENRRNQEIKKESSFETDEFWQAALDRTYGG